MHSKACFAMQRYVGDVIVAIRLQEIHSRQIFAALDRSEEGFCDTCKEAFDVDPSLGFKHERARASVNGVEHGKSAARHEDTN